MGIIRLNKTKKIAIASIAGLVVLLAVVLPLSVGNSDSTSKLSAASTSNGGNASPTGSGTGSTENDVDTGRTDNVYEETNTNTGTDTVTTTVTEDVTESTGMLAPEFNENCPCFTAESLDIAVTQVASGAFTFNPEKTCTGSATGSDGIIYNDFSGEHPAAMGFQVMDGECREADALYVIDGKENASCRELLAAKCSEHASVIAAASLATATKDGCEHFSAKDVSPVVDRLNAGLVTANKNNCQEFSIGYSSSLSWMEDDIAREYSTTFDESTGEYKVVADDQIFITDSATKNACAAIVDNACKSLVSVKMADGCEYFSKSDMDGIVEAINGGVMVAADNSCPEVSIGGSTQTLSWLEDISDGTKAFRTYSASWDESLSAAVVRKDDQVHTVNFEVMSSCAAVIKTACDMIKGKPDDGVISISGGQSDDRRLSPG